MPNSQFGDRLETVPARSDAILVTSTEYNNRGEAFKTIDPKAIENRREFDHVRRLTKLIEQGQRNYQHHKDHRHKKNKGAGH